MKRLLIFTLLTIFSLPGILWAADPIIGTWKLDVSKSNYPPNQKPPKKHTEIYMEIEGGRIDFAYDVIQGDGSKISFKATWPVEGGVASDPDGQFTSGRSYVEMLLKPGDWYVTVLQDGKQFGVIHKVVSKDGKTLIQTYNGLNDQGTQIDRMEFFNRK